MNLKTTLFLLVIAAGCATALLIFKPDPAKIREARLHPVETPAGEDAVEKTLLKDTKLGDIVKVSCTLAHQSAPWVFEKSKVDDKDVWDISAPLKARAAGWQVDAIHRRMTELHYDVAYSSGAGGPTPAEAGFDKPAAVVTISDKEGQSATVEIGRAAGRNETYARLAGGETIVVAKSNLSTLFKDSVLEYRDNKLFDFTADDAVRLEVSSRINDPEGEPQSYVLAKDGEQWSFESPFAGKATEEIKAVLTAFASARVSKWKDSDPAKLPIYGLERPAVSMTVTVRKEKPAPKEAKTPEGPDADAGAEQAVAGDSTEGESAEKEPPPVVETRTYTLHISNVSPLGEDTNLYVRVGDEAAVGTLPKTTTDKLAPVESKWRDMRVTTSNAARANRLQVTLGGRTADLIVKDGKWVFADGSAAADDDAVKELLKAVSGLNAKAFVQLKPGEEASMGLAAPEAVVTLTLPGQDEPERITVGGPSDGDLKRMYFVRRNDATSVGKVRTDDLKSILRPIADFRSREVFSLGGGQAQRIALSYENPLDEGRVEAEFQVGSDGAWKMTRPLAADVVKTRFDALLGTFKSLKGKRYVGDGEDLGKYGLASPAVKVGLTYVPGSGSAGAAPSGAARSESAPVDAKAEVPASADVAKEAAKAAKEKKADKEKKPGKGGPRQDPPESDVAPPQQSGSQAPSEGDPVAAPALPAAPETVEFLVGAAGDKHYLKRADAAAVYELERELFDRFTDEYRSDTVMKFTESRVTGFSIRSGSTTQQFEKRQDRWVMTAERDLPLDQKAVGALVVNLSDLKTTRYVRYGVTDLGAYGLAEAAREATVMLDDGEELGLLVSSKPCEKDAGKRVYAVRRGEKDVFLLAADMVQRLDVKLETLESKD